MTDDVNERKDLHQRLRRAGILSPVFTFSRKRGILRTIPWSVTKEERVMPEDMDWERWKQELPPPDGANAEGSTEIIRAWIVHGELGVTMRHEVVSHPAQWGGILADLARWVMVLFHEGTDREELSRILNEVVRGFEQRLDNPDQTHIEVDNPNEASS